MHSAGAQGTRVHSAGALRAAFLPLSAHPSAAAPRPSARPAPQVGLLVASEAILRHGHPSSFCCQAWGPLARQLLCADPPLAPARLAGCVSAEALAALTRQAAALVEGCLAVGRRAAAAGCTAAPAAWRPRRAARRRALLPGRRGCWGGG
jgi:hypothetical protein